MSDLQQYILKRKKRDTEFEAGYEIGFEEFKVTAVLGAIRKDAYLIQAELVKLHHTIIYQTIFSVR